MKPPLEIRNGEVTYVMRCGDYVKIGHSIDPERRRLHTQQPANNDHCDVPVRRAV